MGEWTFGDPFYDSGVVGGLRAAKIARTCITLLRSAFKRRGKQGWEGFALPEARARALPGYEPLPSEEGTAIKVFRTITLKPRPEASVDCLTCARAFAVKVVPKRLPVFPFSGFDLYHNFRNDAFYGLYNLLEVQKTGKREVVLGQPLPQTLYSGATLNVAPTPDCKTPHFKNDM